MNRKRSFIVVLLVLIVAHGSDASLIGKDRKLMAAESGNKTVQVSPSPGPFSREKSDPSRIAVDKSGNGSPRNAPSPTNWPKSQPPSNLANHQCDMSSPNNRCRDQKSMTACIQPSGGAHGKLSLLVLNDGESTLNVKISQANIPLEGMQIPKHQAEKINISATAGKIPSIVLNAGDGDCVIHMEVPISQGDFFKMFPSYAAQVTPLHGVYFLSFTTLIIGGMWACCKWGKRGQQVDGIPYQELEMGQSDSLSAINVETAEGWDQGWDENWDEEKAVKSPGGNHIGNVSANGLNSRSSKRDGWENDWDD